MANSEIDKELAKSLLVARKKPRNFAMVVKGVTVLKLMLSKKPFRDAELLEAKKQAKGNEVVTGVCAAGEGAELQFRVLEESPVQDAKLKAFIKEEAGLSVATRFVIDAKVTPILDESNDADVDLGKEMPQASSTNASEPPPPPPPPPTASGQPSTNPSASSTPPQLPPQAIEFTQRLKALKPELDKLIASAATSAGEAKLLASEAATLARKGDFSGALALLLRLETSVATGLKELAGDTASGFKDAAAQFNARFKSLMPSIKSAADAGTALGLEIAKLAKEAGAMARESGLSGANLLLDQIESRLRSLVSDDAGNAFRDRLQGLLEHVTSLVELSPDDRQMLEQMIAAAKGVGESGDLLAANQSLDQVDSRINQLLSDSRRGEAAQVIPQGKVSLEKTKIRWSDFRGRSLAGFEELIVILREFDEEDDREVIQILEKLTNGLPTGVDSALEALEAAVNARDSQAISANKEVLAEKLDNVKQYLELHRDTLETCEENPHDVAVALVQPMEETIVEISEILSQL